jgi:S-methylmethionine-dependent homocysteine/selenocysteine methylase
MLSYESRLKNGEVLVLDGAIAIELTERGIPVSDKGVRSNALVNIDHPDFVRQMHLDYIAAGAEVISVNTFGTGLAEMELVGLADEFDAINRAAVKIALEAREQAGTPDVAVLGVISCVPPAGSVPGAHDKLAHVLADAGVDAIAVEMVGTRDGGIAAISAVQAAGLPVWMGMSTDRAEDGRLVTLTKNEHYTEMSPPEDVRADIQAFVAKGIDALTVMHTEIADVPETLAIMREEFDGPIGAYPHHGRLNWDVLEWQKGELSPEEFAAAALQWVDAGAQIVGGCCGIGAAHIAALSSALGRSTALANG